MKKLELNAIDERPIDPMEEIARALNAEHLKYKSEARMKWNRKHESDKVSEAPHFEILKFAMETTSFEGERIVDFGCGNGKLGKMIRGYRAYAGIDISNQIIDELNKSRINDKTMFFSDTMSNVKLPSKAEITFCLNTLEHIPEHILPKALLKLSQNSIKSFISINLEDKDSETIQSESTWINELSVYFDISRQKKIGDVLIVECNQK